MFSLWYRNDNKRKAKRTRMDSANPNKRAKTIKSGIQEPLLVPIKAESNKIMCNPTTNAFGVENAYDEEKKQVHQTPTDESGNDREEEAADIPKLLTDMQQNDPEAVALALEHLDECLDGSRTNCLGAIRRGGIGFLMTSMMKWQDEASIQSQCCRCIISLTYNLTEKDQEEVKEAFLELGVLEIIMSALKNFSELKFVQRGMYRNNAVNGDFLVVKLSKRDLFKDYYFRRRVSSF